LATKDIVHRDLAARNLLVSEVQGKAPVVKVTDFGLSRKVNHGQYYTKSGRTGDPIKWAAPETFKVQTGKPIFQGKVSTRSDRWSFGVVLFELFDLCRRPPYPDLSNVELKGMLGDQLDVSTALPLDDAPPGIKEILKSCLNYSSHDRPTFAEILTRLNKVEEDIKAGGQKSNAWKQDTVAASTIIIKTDYGEGGDEEEEPVSHYESQENEEDKNE